MLTAGVRECAACSVELCRQQGVFRLQNTRQPNNTHLSRTMESDPGASCGKGGLYAAGDGIWLWVVGGGLWRERRWLTRGSAVMVIFLHRAECLDVPAVLGMGYRLSAVYYWPHSFFLPVFVNRRSKFSMPN